MATVETTRKRTSRLLSGGRSTPGKVWLLTAPILILTAVLIGVATLAIDSARDGLRTIGHGAGPQVVAVGDLNYALSDMNAQVASILLSETDGNIGVSGDAALKQYQQRRSEASQAVLQAVNVAGEDADQRDTIRAVLDDLGSYERLASQAMAFAGEGEHDRALEIYQEATRLMKGELLPAAAQTTKESDQSVQRTYETTSSNARLLPIWIGGLGLLTIVALIALQIYLAARFRRLFNPALVVATLGIFALLIACIFGLRSAGDNLQVAKEDGHDEILSVSLTRGTNKTLQSDEATYRLEMQQFVDSAQKRGDIEDRMGPLQDGFESTDKTMVSLIDSHEKVFTNAIREGEAALSSWHLIFPIAGGAVILLTLLGIRPRLVEYR